MYPLTQLEHLEGKKIHRVIEDTGSLYFWMESGEKYECVPTGDCCAQCYIQHISDTNALVPGATIRNVETIDLPQPETSGYDVSEVWGHRITTDKGVCSIEMRVDHNGYYGGWLLIRQVDKWPGTPHEDCLGYPELANACGCMGKQIDDY